MNTALEITIEPDNGLWAEKRRVFKNGKETAWDFSCYGNYYFLKNDRTGKIHKGLSPYSVFKKINIITPRSFQP